MDLLMEISWDLRDLAELDKFTNLNIVENLRPFGDDSSYHSYQASFQWRHREDIITLW